MTEKQQRILKKTLKYILVLIIAVCLFIGVFFVAVYAGVFGKLPSKEVLKAINNEEASLVFSEDNFIIGKYFAKNRTNSTWEEIPEHLKEALIATEDKRFFSHKGYDTQSYLRVFFKSILLGGDSGGGSTLTQQLVKNLYGRKKYGFLSIPVNKTKEIAIAARLEAIYNKEELLVLYLNSVPFGENIYGVETAANRYFNKTVAQLHIEESAVLVGLLKANTYFNPRINPKNSIERRNTVLKLMENEKYLTSKATDSLQKLPLNLSYTNITSNAPAGYFVYQVKQQTLKIVEEIKLKTGNTYNLETDGLKIHTTLNLQIQKLASSGIKKQLSVMQQLLDKELNNSNFKKEWFRSQRKKFKTSEEIGQKKEIEVFEWNGMQTKKMHKLDSLWHYYKMLHAAVLIINPKNGYVLTYIGGNDYKTLPFDMVNSHRQIASAFKPILYATALENGFKANTYLENAEKEYPEYDNWKPQNFDYKQTPDSTVALWYALANSMNLPTVDLFAKVGEEPLLNTLRRLNFPAIKKTTPSIALGTLDVSLSEITKAYASIANKGEMNKLITITKITDNKGVIIYEKEPVVSELVFSEETSNKITAILQKAIDEGTGIKIRNKYGIHSDLAGKTGTAQNYSNAWFMSYTPNLVIGTWVGASSPSVHFSSGNGSGSSLALPISAYILKGMEADAKLKANYLTSFEIPDEVYESLESDPYQEKGIEGFFKRLFNFKRNKNKTESRNNTVNRRN